MCRIFACVSKSPEADAPRVRAVLRDFARLADTGCVPTGVPAGHHDGWGLVGYRGGEVVFYERAALSAASDPRFAAAADALVALAPDAVIAHLRKTSRGTNAVDNCQPFVTGSLSFCHNGRLGGPYAEGGPNGESDSLMAFRAALAGGGTVDSLQAAVAAGRVADDAYTGAITVASDGSSLVVRRDWNAEHPDAAARGLDGYYTLSIFEDGDLRAACSEPLPALAGFGAQPLRNGEEVRLR